MKPRIGVVIIALIAYSEITVAEQTKVRPEVWQNVREKGVVTVLVLLNLPWKLGRNPKHEEILKQRQAISSTQRTILRELTGTTCRLIQQFETTPTIALEVGPDALAVLERSDAVAEVDIVHFSDPA
jgi:hypothetical protein